MADVSYIFGGEFTPKIDEKRVDPPDVQVIDAMLRAGINPPQNIIMDGKIRRFRSDQNKKDESGWYVIFSDGEIAAGAFGCWRLGLTQTWKADVGRELKTYEIMAIAKRQTEAKAQREIAQERKHEIASSTVSVIWEQAGAAWPEHEYLQRKGVEPHGIRATGDGRLIVPMYSSDGELTSLQYISGDGEKKYHAGGRVKGAFFVLGDMQVDGQLYIAEGYATAATITEETGKPCVVAFSAGNLVDVTGAMRERYPLRQIVIVADNDKSGVGKNYADQAAAKHKARVIMPPAEGDVNDFRAAGGDVVSLLDPPVRSANWLVPADEFCSKPAPVKWLVKHWFQDEALIMVHGPSGGGKTFFVIAASLAIASSQAQFFGHKVSGGTVVYLAGEGHHGMRARIAAWKQENGQPRLDCWVSSSGCDLNTPEGYSQVVGEIAALGIKPSMIVVDTLHRFLSGDENKAQDAKTMLDACGGLIREYSCGVVLVHHTGVSDEAQHRARGSSAWRGALDIEISVVPGKDGDPAQIVQRKNKDSELAKDMGMELKSVPIDGWFDEDGEPVTSAVAVQAEIAEKKKIDSKLAEFKKIFGKAWNATGAELVDDQPYVSRSGMLNYLTKEYGKSESNAKMMLKPSQKDRFIGRLIDQKVIEDHQSGWVVACLELSSSLTLSL
jgi:phage/plasmid primase-like uncharacterized protein